MAELVKSNLLRSIGKGVLWFLAGLVVLLFFFSSILLYEQQKQSQLIEQENLALITDAEQQLQRFLTDSVKDVLYLAALPNKLAQANNQSLVEQVAPLVESYIGLKPEVVQVRWLNKSGREVLRFNHDDGIVQRVADNQLQDKRNRYYFTDAIGLKEGEIALSKLDLNVERNRVEVPHRPVIRISTPIYLTGSREVLGVMVINVCAKSLFKRLHSLRKQDSQSLFLANENGYWLLPPEGQQAWGDQLANSQDNLFNVFPQLGELIKTQFWIDNHWIEGKLHLHAMTIHPFIGHDIENMIAVNQAENFFFIAQMPEPESLVVAVEDSPVIKDFLISMLVFLVLSSVLLAVFFYRREKLEERSRFQEQMFNHFFNNIPEVMLLSDATGRIVFQNEKAQQVISSLQLQNLDFVGTPGQVLLSEQERASEFQRVASLSGANFYQNREFSFDYMGSDVHYLIQTFCLHNEQKDADLLALIMIDLTPEKHLQQTLKQTQKMDAIGQLTGGIAHDFNNLLTGVMGNLDLAKRFMNIEIDQAIYQIDQALNASEKGAELIKRLMTISRKKSVEVSEVNLVNFLEKERDLLATTLPSNIELELDIVDEEILIMVDDVSLETALINLISNARDAVLALETLHEQTSKRQIVEIKLRVKLLAIEQISSWKNLLLPIQPGNYAVVEVIDMGVGMHKEQVEKVVEPFFTTKDVGKGTGLGLSMVYAFVQQSQGSMLIDSEYLKGTTVSLILPLAESSPAAETTVEMRANVVKQARILLVDDDLKILEMAQTALLQSGIEVLAFSSPQQALNAEIGQAVDMVITDVRMPQMNGIEFVKKLQAQGTDVPIIFTTGYMQEEAHELESLSGRFVVIEKPYRMERLVKKVSEFYAEEDGE